MSTALATTSQALASNIIEMVTGGGDLGKLTVEQRAKYIMALCDSIGLNPLSRPIEFVSLQGKTVPYAKKDCTDQLRQLRKVSITIISKEIVDGILTVTARATTPDGRCDEDAGSVVVANLKGEQAANATMKAITKAKRRVTLSICGLGFLDESEIETVPGARVLTVAEEPSTTTPLAPVEPIRAVVNEDKIDDVMLFGELLRNAKTEEQLESARANAKKVVKDIAKLQQLSAIYFESKSRIEGEKAAQ